MGCTGSNNTMVNCKTCNTYIDEDKRRRYCDRHREYRGGEWRQRNYIKNYYREKKRKYSMRQTRVTGTGFSEHLITNKEGKPIFIKERISVRKEKRRIGI